ncbi:MAG: type II toxin-antitoxin system VapC family toxin [bacterium]|nr:type II toxin-antitoxin system VapC family toxin [bacterium]
MDNVFLDTSYAIALSVSKDQNHEKALQIADFLEVDTAKLITTRAVVLEIGNALSAQKYRLAAIDLLGALEEDPDVEIIPITEELYERGFQLFKERSDKEWGVIDCISFVVMQDQGITTALTADKHSQQHGFKALLCD